MLNKAIFTLVLIFIPCFSMAESSKLKILQRAHELNGQILILSEEASQGSNTISSSEHISIRNRLFEMLDREDDIDVLVVVAKTNDVFYYPGNASDEAFDDLFDQAWRRCIFRISSIGGEPALEALEAYKIDGHLDGGRSLYITEAISKIKKNNG